MGTSDLSILNGIRQNMAHLANRQRVISENLANSETPGYRAREVDAPDFSSMLNNVGAASGGTPGVATPGVAITDAMRALGATQPISSPLIYDKDVSETKPDGNNVTIEDQLLKMGQIQADFAAMTNIYRKQMGMLQSALGKRG